MNSLFKLKFLLLTYVLESTVLVTLLCLLWTDDYRYTVAFLRRYPLVKLYIDTVYALVDV